MAILTAASEKLASAQTMAFTAVSTYERAARNGQPLYYSSIHEVLLAASRQAEGGHSRRRHAGRVLLRRQDHDGLCAVGERGRGRRRAADHRPLLDHAWEKAAIYFPFADVLASDPIADLSKTLKSAFYVGRSIAVGGVPTDMIALAGDEVAAEVWIGVDRPPAATGARRLRERAGARALPDRVLGLAARPPGRAGRVHQPEGARGPEHIDFAPPGDAAPPPEVNQPPAEKKP